MVQIQFRVKPVRSLGDLDIPRIKKGLANLPGVTVIQICDETAWDAFFVTIVVTVADPTETVLAALRNALLKLRNLTPYIVDKHGYDKRVDSIDAEGFREYFAEPEGPEV